MRRIGQEEKSEDDYGKGTVEWSVKGQEAGDGNRRWRSGGSWRVLGGERKSVGGAGGALGEVKNV